MANQKTSQETLSKAQFAALVDAYLGARAHERWAMENGTEEESERAREASKAARKALEDGVFGP